MTNFGRRLDDLWADYASELFENLEIDGEEIRNYFELYQYYVLHTDHMPASTRVKLFDALTKTTNQETITSDTLLEIIRILASSSEYLENKHTLQIQSDLDTAKSIPGSLFTKKS